MLFCSHSPTPINWGGVSIALDMTNHCFAESKCRPTDYFGTLPAPHAEPFLDSRIPLTIMMTVQATNGLKVGGHTPKLLFHGPPSLAKTRQRPPNPHVFPTFHFLGAPRRSSIERLSMMGHP